MANNLTEKKNFVQNTNHPRFLNSESGIILREPERTVSPININYYSWWWIKKIIEPCLSGTDCTVSPVLGGTKVLAGPVVMR